MGASFLLFKRDPEYDVDMSYRAVHICRMELLKLVKLDKAYSNFMSESTETYWRTHLMVPLGTLIQS